MSRPLETMTARALAVAMLDAQTLHGRALTLDDALLSVNAAWRCEQCMSLWLRGQACRLCMMCRCGMPADVGGRPCPTCEHRLD